MMEVIRHAAGLIYIYPINQRLFTMETFKNYHETTGAKRKVYFSLVAGILMLFVYNATVAQDRWSIALGSGVNFPTQDLGDAKLRTGFGFEGTVAYRFMP